MPHENEVDNQRTLDRASRTPEARLLMQRLTLATVPCVLCGTTATNQRGIFATVHAERWGGKAGKVRLIGYGLCQPCSTLPNLAFKIEAQLARTYLGPRN